MDIDTPAPEIRPALSQLTLSIVFSFRNEEENIPILLPRVRRACSGLGLKALELVFVNDCSTDRSLQILLDEQERHSDIVIVNTSRPFGVAECVMAGLCECTGDFAVYMDADLQDPPELIPKMLERALLESADVVFTTRTTRKGEPWLKLKITAMGYWIINKFSSIEFPANTGDFKLISRRVINQISKMREHKPFLRGLVTWVGFKQVQVFYEREPRAAGKSHFFVLSRHVVYHFLDSALISFSDAPLKLSLALGALVSMGAAGLFIWILIQKAIGWALPGWSAVMATLLVIGGIQIFILGIFGLYIHTIYLEVKGRPLYIIDKVLRPKSKDN